MTTAAQALRALRDGFRAASLPNGDLDARLLLEHVCGWTALGLLRDPDRVLTQKQCAALEAARARRLGGEPVHRIMGFREFHGLRLHLTPDTLEPRPDTEILVDAMLPFLRQRAAEQGSCRLLDLGTGTGAIALALLKEVPELRAVGTDLSEGALEAARTNAHINGIADRFDTLRSDWLEGVTDAFDAIVSNPPYIASGEINQLAPEVVLHDPRRALDGGSDGLAAYRVIAQTAGAHLVPEGRIGLEIGWDQKAAVQALFEHAGFVLLDAQRDLGGNDRALVFQAS